MEGLLYEMPSSYFVCRIVNKDEVYTMKTQRSRAAAADEMILIWLKSVQE